MIFYASAASVEAANEAQNTAVSMLTSNRSPITICIRSYVCYPYVEYHYKLGFILG